MAHSAVPSGCLCVLTGLVASAAPALGQSQPGLISQTLLNSAHRVAAGSDVDPLRGDPRVMPSDLRAPVGFQDVYQLNGTDRFGNAQTLFARRSGGLTAVFPRSVYVPTRAGLIPTVPAGTVFVIDSGRPNEPEPSISHAFNALNYTAPIIAAPLESASKESLRAAPRQPSPTKTAGRPILTNDSIWNNEEYRRKIVDSLLSSARLPPSRPGN